MKTMRAKVNFSIMAVVIMLSACTAKPTGLSISNSIQTPTMPRAGLTPSPKPAFTPVVLKTSSPQPTSTSGILSSATPADKAALPVMGMEIYGIDEGNGLELVKQSGASWVRRNALIWSDVEPEQGKRNWAALAGLETEMKNASSHDLHLIMIVRSTPTWAQKTPGVACGAVRTDKLEAFASFMHDLVRRYSQPPYSVKYWEIGNEPDVAPGLVPPDSVFGCWGDAQDATYGGGYYAEMLKAVYPQVKAADEQAQVLTGGLLLDCDPVNPPETAPGSGKFKDCKAARFLEGILRNGGGDYFDMVSYHAYDYYNNTAGAYSNDNWHSAWNTTGPVLIAKARYLRSILTAYGHPDKPLINSESALLCYSKGGNCQSEDFASTKSNYLVEAFASARAESLLANLWYSLVGWHDSGLVDAAKQPLPAYNAFRFGATMLQPAAFVGSLSQFDGVAGYEYSLGSQRFWILWSLDGTDHKIHLPAIPQAVYDVSGAPVNMNQDLDLTVAPLYIVWGP